MQQARYLLNDNKIHRIMYDP